MTDKQAALQIIEGLPESVSLEDIAYQLYVCSRIERGIEQLDAGESVSHEEAMKVFDKWLRPAGH